MRTLFLLAALGASAFAQTAPDQVFTFKYTGVAKDMNEIGVVVHGVSDAKTQVSVDEKTMTANGNADELALAAWLFPILDRPGNEQGPVDPPAAEPEYRMAHAPDPDNIVHVYYLPGAQTVQQLQELATAVRSTTELRRIFVYLTPRILVTRGTADQTAKARWMFAQLTSPRDTRPQTYQPSNDNDVYSVFHLSTPKTMQDFQEVATLLRSTAEIPRLFTYNADFALAVRGTADQIAVTQFLVNELDQPSHTSQSAEYHMTTANDSIVQVFYLPDTATVADFQKFAGNVRAKAGIRRLFTYNAPRAIVARGTAAQMNEIAQSLPEQKKPN